MKLDRRTVLAGTAAAFAAPLLSAYPARADAKRQALVDSSLESARKILAGKDYPDAAKYIQGARGVLINITGGPDLCLHEVNEAASMIQEEAHDDANIIFGAVIDPSFPAGQVKLTLIATGFDSTRPNVQRTRSFPATVANTSQQQPAQPQFVAAPAAQPQPAQPQRTPVQPAPRATPSFSSTDDLDIPPFLRNRNRQRGQ